MKRKILYSIVGLILLCGAFFAGMEYKAYQIRSALQDAFTGTTSPNTDTTKSNTVMEQAKEEKMTTVPMNVGEDIQLATIKLNVKGAEEKQTLSASYGSPKVAKEGTKFVLVSMDITNTTKSAFTLSPDFLLVDDAKREFSTYSESIGSVKDYLDYRDLSPSVKETGVFVYELPTDAKSYSLVFAKAGTKDLYTVKLK